MATSPTLRSPFPTLTRMGSPPPYRVESHRRSFDGVSFDCDNGGRRRMPSRRRRSRGRRRGEAGGGEGRSSGSTDGGAGADATVSSSSGAGSSSGASSGSGTTSGTSGGGYPEDAGATTSGGNSSGCPAWSRAPRAARPPGCSSGWCLVQSFWPCGAETNRHSAKLGHDVVHDPATFLQTRTCASKGVRRNNV